MASNKTGMWKNGMIEDEKKSATDIIEILKGSSGGMNQPMLSCCAD